MNLKRKIFCSAYLAIGFLLSHLFHVQAYRSQGATKLATWLTQVFPNSSRNMDSALLLALILSLFVLLVSILLSRELARDNIFTELRFITAGLAAFIILSQMISSSVLRLLYESGFCFVFIVSTLIHKVFLTPARQESTNKEMYERLWDLLRLSIPMALGFSAVFGGVGAISSFYDTPQAFIHRQIYRHLYLTAYFATGMLLFVMWPIFAQILEMHAEIYIKKNKAN